MCCFLSLGETCQTYVLRVQIWVWNLQLPPVLLLCPSIWGPSWTGWELGHPSSRDCLSLGRLFRGSKNYIEDFTGLTTLWPYLERCNSCLSTDMDSWLESLSFAGSFYFWRWMAWTWNKGKEGAQNSPPSYWKPRSSYNRAALLDVFLKDSSECMLRLDAKFADIEQERRKLLINS